jgi:outer membrane protein OmpA-like peptidoglycan-associated protein
MIMKRILILLFVCLLLTGACATKRQSDAEAPIPDRSMPAEAATRDSAADRIMDPLAGELQRALAGSKTASLWRKKDFLVIMFRSDRMFSFDSAVIKPAAAEEIKRVAGVLVRYPERSLRIEGHTDAIGAAEYNMTLSGQRAESVRNELLGSGLLPERIQAVGFGATRPVASNATPEGRSQNRRVQLVIAPESGR